MVEIRVAVADSTRALGLINRLGRIFQPSSVSFDGPRKEVCVRSEWESRSVVEVLSTVEAWLAAEGPPSATLWVGDRSYTMVGPAGPETLSGHAA